MSTYNLKAGDNIALTPLGSDLTISTLTATVLAITDIVAGTPGAGQIQWSGTGPYVATWTHGLTFSTKDDYIVQTVDSNDKVIIPASVEKTLTQVIITSNSNLDMVATILGQE